MKKIIFFGTPFFAEKILEKLLLLKVEIVAVVTQPPKIFGRKKELKKSEVHELALKEKIPVIAKENIFEVEKEIENLDFDLILTCAYGKILSDKILNSGKLKAVNIHASLLPKYRGGAPIHWALIHGESKTGITLMHMEQELDSGDILFQKELTIKEKDNLKTLTDRLIILAQKMLDKHLLNILENKVNPKKQNSSEVTYAKIIDKNTEHISFRKSSLDVYNKIRGLYPSPTGYTNFYNKRVKLISASLEYAEKSLTDYEKELFEKKVPGSILKIDDNAIIVRTKTGLIALTEIQFESKKVMNPKEIKNGNFLKVNDIFS